LSVVPLVAFLAVPGLASAQGQATREITGKVVQAGTNTPLADATVGLLGSPAGVRTNELGQYRIRVPQEDVTLLVRAIGFKRGTTRVTTSQATADFTLERDVLQLEGVTVTGAATTIEKKNAATAVAAVNSDQLSRVAAPSLESSLQGKVVGASINMNNGAPGGGGQIQIRSAATLIGNIQPLFVVDGVVISNATRSNRLSVVTGSLNSAEENGTNRLADLNPNDIENIEILKGPAASALYGTAAANGVILITTKRGRAGAAKWNGSAPAYYREDVRRDVTAGGANVVAARVLYVDSAVARAAGIDTDDVLTFTDPAGVVVSARAAVVAIRELDGVPAELQTARLELEVL